MESQNSSNGKPSALNESDVYDRQIRLWGAEAQAKMASAKVLYINISGVSSEILKNLILAGISAAICDGRPYPEAILETPSSFLPPTVDSSSTSSSNEKETENDNDDSNDVPNKKRMKSMTVGEFIQPHVHELNPLLDECEITQFSSSTLDTISDEYFMKFDIIIASLINLDDAKRLSKLTSSNHKKFYFVHSFGFNACAFIDLGPEHVYRKEIGKDKLSDLQKLNVYTPFETMMDRPLHLIKDRWHKDGPPRVYVACLSILNYYQQVGEWPCMDSIVNFVKITIDYLESQGLSSDYLGDKDELKQLGLTANAEMSPVCAVMGGVIGNEIIKVISGKGEPANNVLLFNGKDGGCISFTVTA